LNSFAAKKLLSYSISCRYFERQQDTLDFLIVYPLQRDRRTKFAERKRSDTRSDNTWRWCQIEARFNTIDATDSKFLLKAFSIQLEIELGFKVLTHFMSSAYYNCAAVFGEELPKFKIACAPFPLGQFLSIAIIIARQHRTKTTSLIIDAKKTSYHHDIPKASFRHYLRKYHRVDAV
jgi:hypothetical protein